MGCVLQRIAHKGSDGTRSSTHTPLLNSISESSPCRQQEHESTWHAENPAGYVQQAGNHGFASSAVQGSALSFPHVAMQQGSSLSPEQRARMEYHKAMALARRREKLKQQNQEEELLLNQLTLVHSTPSSRPCIPVQSTPSSQQVDAHLPPHGAKHAGAALASTSSHLDIYQGPALGLTDGPTLSTHHAIYGVGALASTHDASTYSSRYLQHPSPESHQDMHGGSILTSTQSVQLSQEDKCATFISVHNSVPLPENNQFGGLAPTFVHSPSSVQQGSHSGLPLDTVHVASEQQIDHSASTGHASHGSLTLQHGSCVGSSLTLEQRARMAHKREEALAKRKEQQKQEHHLHEMGTFLDRLTNLPLQKIYQDDGSSLTPAQIAYIAQEEEAAVARRTKGLQQDVQLTATQHFNEDFKETQNTSTVSFCEQPQYKYRGPPLNYVQSSQHSDGSLTSVQSLTFSQQGTCSGLSLSQEQRARMARQREMAIVKRNARLGQLHKEDGHHSVLCHVQCLASSQQDMHGATSLTQEHRARMAHQKELAIAKRNARFQLRQQQDEHHHTHLLTYAQSLALSQEDTCSGSSLTPEQKIRMAHQKEMAIMRRNARQSQQQHNDECHPMHHKLPNSKQGTSPVCAESQKFATSWLSDHNVDCCQIASNSYSSSQQNNDGSFFFTPVEGSLSSQEDSYGAPFLSVTQNCRSAASTEAFSSCSQEYASILSTDHAVTSCQLLALNHCGSPTLSQQQVAGCEENADSVSLTPEQRERMVTQKERALAKRRMVLEQRRLLQHHANQPSELQVGCLQRSTPCSPVYRAGSCEYLSAECCDSFASDCCRIASQESQFVQK